MPRLFGQGPEGETFEHLAHKVGALLVLYQSTFLSVSVSSSPESSSASQRSS